MRLSAAVDTRPLRRIGTSDNWHGKRHDQGRSHWTCYHQLDNAGHPVWHRADLGD